MEFNPHFLGSIRSQKAGRTIAIKSHLGVGCIMAHQDIIISCKFHDFSEKLQIGNRGCRIVRVVDEHDTSPGGDFVWNRIKVRQETVLTQKRHKIGFSAGKHSGNMINRIRRCRYQRHIARIDKGQWKMRDSLFAPNKRNHLRIRVQLNPESFLVPFGYSFFKIAHS